MSNLMKALGSEALQDPAKLEREIQTAAAEYKQAYVDRNIARKLTPAERQEKKERKLFDDPYTLETIVSVLMTFHTSRPDSRSMEMHRLTSCTILPDGISVVVVEGGSNSIKIYVELMVHRIHWAAAVNDGRGRTARINLQISVLVWLTSVAKQIFNRFSVHECITEEAVRKVFSDTVWSLLGSYRQLCGQAGLTTRSLSMATVYLVLVIL